jgi:hypothetical protein
LGDRPARIFYQGLTDGLTLSEATIEAREEARKDGDATWLSMAILI